MTDWIGIKENAAADRVRDVLAKPMGLVGDIVTPADFNPWDIFPSLYGSYAREFDLMALRVLVEIWDGNPSNIAEDLASQMFREMLCTSDLCDYGSSPRVCFATQAFKTVLPQLIAKWQAYSDIQWSRSA